METPTSQATPEAKPGKLMALCQHWLESERGWGKRPDGYSLHLTRDDLKDYLAAYWAEQPDSVPDEYSRPDGSPYWAEVDAAIHAEIAASPNGIRCYRGAPPQEK